jgi:hypothetical protein
LRLRRRFKYSTSVAAAATQSTVCTITSFIILSFFATLSSALSLLEEVGLRLIYSQVPKGHIGSSERLH